MSISRAISPRASLLSDLEGGLAGAAAGLWPGRRGGQPTLAIVRGALDAHPNRVVRV